jgi:hypothetical protein
MITYQFDFNYYNEDLNYRWENFGAKKMVLSF